MIVMFVCNVYVYPCLAGSLMGTNLSSMLQTTAHNLPPLVPTTNTLNTTTQTNHVQNNTQSNLASSTQQ